MNGKTVVSPLAGRWFAADGPTLRREIGALTVGLAPARRSDICAAIVPHAGYAYSGRVAAEVYLSLDPTAYDRVVILAPSHSVAMENRISVSDAVRFVTPLGSVEVDTAWVERFRQLPFAVGVAAAHAREHADQIQLPLIQACLSPALPVVCLVCGQFGEPALRSAARQLRPLLSARTLLVVSSDFTHYGAAFGYAPFVDKLFARLEALDLGIFDRIAAHDLDGFLARLDQTGATVCGRVPLAFLLALMPADARVQRLSYATSGAMTDDTQHSVSYIGALVAGCWRGSDQGGAR